MFNYIVFIPSLPLSYITASLLSKNTTPKPSRKLKMEAETRSDSSPKAGFTVMYYAEPLLSSRLSSIVTSLSGVHWVSQI
jgi:hypothetical protein